MTKEQIKQNNAIELIEKQRYIEIQIYYNTAKTIKDKKIKEKYKKAVRKKIQTYDHILSKLY